MTNFVSTITILSWYKQKLTVGSKTDKYAASNRFR